MPNGLATQLRMPAGPTPGITGQVQTTGDTTRYYGAYPTGAPDAGGAGAPGFTIGGWSPQGGWGQGISGLLTGGAGLLGGLLGKQAYGGLGQGLQDVQGALEGYRQRGVGYYEPFQQAGVGAIPQYQAALQQMQDPSAYISKIMETYHGSPEAHQQMTQMMKASTAGASASGMLGSGAEQTALQKQAQGITAADQQRYLQNVMGVGQQYQRGLGGLMGQGLQAAGGMGGLEGQFGGQVADYMAQQQAAQAKGQQAQAGGLGSMIGGIAHLFGL